MDVKNQIKQTNKTKVQFITLILEYLGAMGTFLAHQIRILDILSWDRKSYLTHVILPRLSHEGCTLVVLELMRHSR